MRELADAMWWMCEAIAHDVGVLGPYVAGQSAERERAARAWARVVRMSEQGRRAA
jgi:hypothetical protein